MSFPWIRSDRGEMERFGNKSVGRNSPTTGPDNRHDDTQSNSSPPLNGHASQQHSSLSDRQTTGQKDVSATKKKAPIRIRISRTKKDTAAAPTKSPAADTDMPRPLQDETTVDSGYSMAWDEIKGRKIARAR